MKQTLIGQKANRGFSSYKMIHVKRISSQDMRYGFQLVNFKRTDNKVFELYRKN